LAREPRTSPIVPSYGESSLADLSASILASLTGDAAANVLGLPEVGRVCLLIVDGLGLELLRGNQAAAPFLAELAFNSRPLTAGFPSTTVTSLGSLGTGVAPGAHGLLGYQVAIPGQERLLNGLHWPKDVDPLAWQPQPTIYERATAAGVAAVHVAPGAFRNSGLTRATLRGAEYRAANSLGALAALSVDALGESDRVLVSAYHGFLDGCGHEYGVSSPAWVNELAHVDKLAEQISAGLPYGSVLYVTADHGMVNVGPDDRIDADAEGSPLRDGVALLGGEPRARHVYARPGAADDVLATWREVLGERAWVMSREEAVKDGLFGPVGTPVSDAMYARIGDVVAACAGTWAIICSRDEPLESSLEGMHGSLTPAEQLVPMLAPAPRLVARGPALSRRASAVPASRAKGPYWPGDPRDHGRPHQGARASRPARDHPGGRRGRARRRAPRDAARRALAARRPARAPVVRHRAHPRGGLRRPGPGPSRPAGRRRPASHARGRRLREGNAARRRERRPAGGRLRRCRLHRRGPCLVAAALLRPPVGPGA
jgi:hypothetical protein